MSQSPNVSKNQTKKTFSVVMLGLTAAFRVLLRKRKMNVTPNLRGRLDTMAETASYGALLHKLKGKEEDRVSSWELFWSFTRQTRNWMQHLLSFIL